jgi:UDP-N-acetylmuramate dehydrogenase
VNKASTTLIREKVSLKPFNSFRIAAKTAFWTEITKETDLFRLQETNTFLQLPHLILGGGSNILLTQDYPGLMIKIRIPGITVLSEDELEVVLRIGAGVKWDELVRFATERGWGGLENLSMIPGETGAAPIQNIGAYGVELESVFVSLDAVHLETGEKTVFDRNMCLFGYRDSIFKRSEKGKYLITSVTLRLSKQPQLRLEYGNLKAVLDSEGIRNPGIGDVSRAVRKIRSSKLPDPTVTGNAGSFFKNPVITTEKFGQLSELHSAIPSYPAGEMVKIPAAWLIDQCGFKGKRVGDAGVHERHALILVNHGKASGADILALADAIRSEVAERFGVDLEPEVNII